MSQKSVNGSYWQTPPGARNQILLIPISLEERIPDDHPVRLLDEILDGLDWTAWESQYSGKLGQPPIHPSILCKVLLFAMIRRVRSSRMIEYQIEHSVDFMWLVSVSIPARKWRTIPVRIVAVGWLRSEILAGPM